MLGSKISKAGEKNSFAVSFLHLKLRRGCKEDSRKVRESKAGIESKAGELRLFALSRVVMSQEEECERVVHAFKGGI